VDKIPGNFAGERHKFCHGHTVIETINIKTEKAKLLKARHIVNPQVSKASNRLSNQVTRSSCSASLDSADN